MRTSLAALVILLLSASGGFAQQPQQAEVTLNPAVRYQTILGWGKTTPWMPAHPLLREQAIDRAVNDLGLNRLRFEGMCGNKVGHHSWEWPNDNDDPAVINWKGFNTVEMDARAADWLVPWKQAVEARGEPFDLYVSPSFFRGGSSGDRPPWLTDPQEYAEWALALLLRLRDQHGLLANYYSICNEAGNDNAFTPQVVVRMIKALMPRLKQHGFKTVIQYPESVNAAVAVRYLEAARNDPEVWKWVGLISYHWYGANNQTSMVKLRDFARERHLPTAQTEFMNLTIDHLYDDLVLGGVSYWEIYGLATPDYQAAQSHISSNTFRGGEWLYGAAVRRVRDRQAHGGGAHQYLAAARGARGDRARTSAGDVRRLALRQDRSDSRTWRAPGRRRRTTPGRGRAGLRFDDLRPRRGQSAPDSHRVAFAAGFSEAPCRDPATALLGHRP
ncbi:MAG: hypothetical protein AMS14_09465 [Planctomycetes bacterium DG_20]|nr:MAG: hypothetical protein AMS14_09465 [Planctomycetes bacterium DG_20]